MSILIRGMEMPKRGHTVTITIVGSGQVYVERFDCLPHVEETIEYTAVPIPPHGRLIDADEFFRIFPELISYEFAAPTIIPASEEGET